MRIYLHNLTLFIFTGAIFILSYNRSPKNNVKIPKDRGGMYITNVDDFYEKSKKVNI